MDENPGWTVDVKSCSPDQRVELAKQLEGSKYVGLLLEVRQRLRKAGCSDQENC
jgi:hypothetical protein